jgi:ElaB/YqjD/DUF883 family membrane-anchored ribosome-binding protein
VEDLTDGLVLAVRKHPLKSVGIAGAIGLGIGALAGRLAKRN